MHIVLKNQPPSPFRGGDIKGGGIHPSHATHNNQGVDTERVNENYHK